MEPDEIRAAWQPLQSPRQSPTSGLRSNLNLALSSPSPRRLREPAQEPSPQLGSHAPFAWAPIRPVTLDLGPPRTATHGMQLSPNVRPAPLGVRTIPTRRPGGNESRYGGSSPEEVGRECAASHVADEKERLRQARSKMAAPQADDELWENALLELAQKAEEELKLASELQAKFDALTMQNEQLQQELSQAAKREQATEKSEQALEAEKNELRKQLEDKEQEAKAKEAASQVQIELLKTELREAQQKAESRAAGKEAADEAYARRAEQDAEQTQESQEAQLELLKKDLKDAQHKAEEAKKAPESKEVQPSLPAESVGETSEMDTQKSDGEKRWEITISKTTEDEKLGLGSSPAEDGKAMFVESLVEGLLEAWNAKCLATGELDCVVKPGDLIISCNGVTGYEEMIQEFRSKKTLQLSLLREAGTKQKKRWLEKVQRNGQSLENAPEHLRSDREVASAEKQQWLTKVKRDGFFLQIAPEHLQKDQEVVTAAVRQNGKALQFASKELKSNQDVVLAAVKASGLALEYAAEALRGEKEFVLAAVQQNGLALKFAAEALQSDKEIAVAAVRQNGLALEHAAPAMKEEKEVVMLAVQQDGRALKFAAAALQAEKEVVLAAVRQNGLALKFAAEALQGDKEIVMVAVQQDGRALKFAAAALQQEKEVVRASWLSRILEDGTKLQYAPEDLRGDREFLLDAVRATKAPWLVQLASKALQEDAELVDQVKREAGTGLVFTWYHSFDCFANMRKVIVATGASVPGGEAYAEVMKKLNATGGGSATVWFDTVPVWGFQANGGKWRHPPTDCGRNDVSVPPPEGRDPMWDSLVESRVSREAPAVGSKHPCWCCHWLRAVRKKVDEGAIICCVVSNIYNAEWVKKYHAGSSEVSDAVADQYKLKREWFRNGRPPNWGEGEIEIHGHDDDDDDGIQRFSRVAPVHPHTQLPLGEGCRWEREALDNLDCTVMAFFMP